MSREYYVAYINPDYLGEFLKEVQSHDDMDGNKVELVEKIDSNGGRFLVLFSREYSYPYILSELRKKWTIP